MVSVGMEVMVGLSIPDFRTSPALSARWVKEVWSRKSSFIKTRSGGRSSLFKTMPHGNPPRWPNYSSAPGIKCPFPPLETTSANRLFSNVPATPGRVDMCWLRPGACPPGALGEQLCSCWPDWDQECMLRPVPTPLPVRLTHSPLLLSSPAVD